MASGRTVVHLALGCNLGDRMKTLRRAVAALDALESVDVVACSCVYETEPWGVTDQPAFLNMAVAVETALEPLELLDAVKDCEAGLGRAPRYRWGPREIDIDLVLWGDTVLETSRLALPHPAFRERAFVLAPLADIAGDAVDPVTGKTVASLAAGQPMDFAAWDLGEPTTDESNEKP